MKPAWLSFKSIYRSFTVTVLNMWLPFFLVLSSGSFAWATESCSSVLLQTPQSETALSIALKLVNTTLTPAKILWNKITYTEVPHYMSHPIYKDIESKFPALQARPVQRLLYYSSNGARKAYNLFSIDGIGLPIPAIKTEMQIQQEARQIPNEIDRIYWRDIMSRSSPFTAYSKVKFLSKKMIAAFTLSTMAIFGAHTVGNVAEVIQARPVYLTVATEVAEVMPLKNSQIQIMNETAPFPHMAIRIGNSVYSHGVKHLSQTPAEQYLKQHIIAENAEPVAGSAAPLNKFLKKASLKKRALDTVVLNLDDSTVLKIRDELMKEIGKPYNNETFVNSCSSMVARILRDQGITIQDPFLDASPSLMLSRLALEAVGGRKNNQGLPLIDGIYEVRYSNENSSVVTMRNFMIRELEGAVLLQVHTLPLRIAQRAYLDLGRPNTENLYVDIPERQNVLNEILKQAENDLNFIQEYQLYMLEREKLLQENPSASLATLKKTYASEFNPYLKEFEAQLQQPGISFEDYQLTKFKIELLQKAM